MAARSHSLHHLRLLPELGGQSLRVVAELVCTAAGLVWLAPSLALLVVLAVLGMPALLLALQPLLTERDLRLRTHAGALGRALARRGVRLGILDEPFRGLDREQRHVLLQRARQKWRAATLLCITHDVQSTQAFDRVLVVEGGQIIEDDAPARLASHPETHYRALLDAEAAVHGGLWCSERWRRLLLVAGRVHEAGRLGSTTGAGGG
jgi:hypothetical protein